jgi:(1->4)-alpha-D-glucan 1-alpha-D-glucosylmutase
VIAPRATYRLQLHPGFGFAQATAALPYLAELGISHLYLSPVLQAAEGSQHGYDVVDPLRVSDVLGGEAAFATLVDAAQRAGLGILLDIVPNHMSIAGMRNRWWLDVLENGAASAYAHTFDVDWSSGPDDRVLLPMLAERYGRSLTSGQLAIVPRASGGPFEVRVGEQRLPLAPHSAGAVVRRAGDRIRHAELGFIGDALCALPTSRDVVARRRRHRDKAVLYRRVRELCDADPRAKQAIADELQAINTDPTELDATLERQHYRLAHWSVSGSQLSYRRFFDITNLVGIRNEDPEVFAETHEKILAWLADGTIDGVRVDHVDGLREPRAYLQRLRDAAPEAWIVVEKILGPHERIPASWPIDGTTGYEFLELASSMLVDPAGERELTRIFESYTGAQFAPAAESRRARLDVMSDALHSELARLTELAVRACAASPACRDYTRAEIETTLSEILAGYPVYRTYFDGSTDDDVRNGRERIATATAAAARARPTIDGDLLAFLGAALAFELPSSEARELALAAQQITGGIIAKGDEDTLLYRQVRMLARCDVGADLATFAVSNTEAHERLAARSPRSLLATSTHDSKRGEDVRARIAVLSEMPGPWADAIARWRRRSDAYWQDTEPDRIFEYQLWQTLVGAWPLTLERTQRFAEKATREARLRTSWRRPDEAYEAARNGWLEKLFADTELMTDIARFVDTLRPHGDRNALAQTLVKLAAPGIPDFYQGAEARDDSLVDPDNRRPVDLAVRHHRLRELRDLSAESVRDDLARAKPWLVRRVLGLRRRAPELFTGGYVALAATGRHAHRVFAFARTALDGNGVREPALIAVVPRHGVSAESWRDTQLELPPANGARWRDVLGDRFVEGVTVAVGQLWETFPVALLVRT